MGDNTAYYWENPTQTGAVPEAAPPDAAVLSRLAQELGRFYAELLTWLPEEVARAVVLTYATHRCAELPDG